MHLRRFGQISRGKCIDTAARLFIILRTVYSRIGGTIHDDVRRMGIQVSKDSLAVRHVESGGIGKVKLQVGMSGRQATHFAAQLSPCPGHYDLFHVCTMLMIRGLQSPSNSSSSPALSFL